MRLYYFPLLALLLGTSEPPLLAQRPAIVWEVRQAINAGDFASAERLLAQHEKRSGTDAAYLEALSWMGRGKLAGKAWDAAERYAVRTREAALAQLGDRKLDDDSSLPLALGASIEVQGQVRYERGQRSEAVAFLQDELARWRDTSIRTRIQKNLNLISLEGKPAPALEMSEWIGERPAALASLRGRTVLLFFWAHWCGDCKQQAPVLARLKRELGDDLVIIGPTQPYGYVAGGADASREEELNYIAAIRRQFYGEIGGMTVPVSDENFRNWGASTTPTLAVIDAQGLVRLYHPGKMSYEELLPHVRPTGASE